MQLMNLGAFDPALNQDTRLFIDPTLLPVSKIDEMAVDATALFQKHFSDIYALISKSNDPNHVARRKAAKMLAIKEVRDTCLGYGGESTSGSSLSEAKRARLVQVAAEIVEVGVDDPYLLPLLGLLEDGIGPDNISDMATGVIVPALAEYTLRVCRTLGVPTLIHRIEGAAYELPTNPYAKHRQSILLVPVDVLRELPTATSWDDVIQAAQQNEELREKLNTEIGTVFKAAALSEADKKKARLRIMKSAAAVELLSEFLKSRSTSYHSSSDPLGLFFFQRLMDTIVEENPMATPLSSPKTTQQCFEVVDAIVEQFKFLLEKKGYWRELWADGKPKKEEAAQRLFNLVAYAYTRAHGIDINQEADSSSGRLDFKFSVGSEVVVVVEVKKSNNRNLIHGLNEQLPEYMESERAAKGIYLVIDFGTKNLRKPLMAQLDSANEKTRGEIGIRIVSARQQLSPSKKARVLR